MTAQPVSAAEVQRFYRVGAWGLRALQDRGLGAERFSADASARWKAFRGELNDSHRLDLLLRDGAAMYPLAFAARAVFGLQGLARDEAFGPEWPSLPVSAAGELLREVEAKPAEDRSADVGRILLALADLWGLRVEELPPAAVQGIGAASRIVLAGVGALIALARHAAQRPDMDLGDQLLLVTDAPGVRQLAGLAAALTGSRKTPRCVGSAADAKAAAAIGFERITVWLATADAGSGELATSRDVATARVLAAELGGG